jgi:peptidoglycan/LPS O-acetylase OafA/YrhL
MNDSVNRKNNFDFLRLLFASLVIFSHSFSLTKNNEILLCITNNQADFGSLSVDVFFIISGYLILNSLKFSKSPANYLYKRCLRLFPALFFMLLVSLLILILVYTGENIFRQNDFYSYLPNNLSLYRIQYNVQNVFENNPYPRAINGSLWSLPYEFTMYLFLLLLYPFRNNRKIVLSVLVISFIISFCAVTMRPSLLSKIFSFIRLDSIQMYRLAAFFIFGSILSLFNLERVNNNRIKFALTFLIIISLFLNVYTITSYIFIPLLVILIGISYSKTLAWFPEKFGDISYGIYIYGFIIQQTLLNYFDLNPYLLALVALIPTYILSYFSWHFVEKKFLKYKNYI